MSFMFAPRDANLGDVQRILYIHVPIAILALSGFALVMVGSLTYLVRRQPRWDAFAHASAQVGLLFASITLITGAIWAKPVWGVWWTWDPKLTTTLILWLMYVAYLMLRAYAPGDKGARFAAVLGIMGFIDTPIIYFSALWWRTVHPPAVIGPLAEPGSMDSSMRLTLIVAMLAFTLLFSYMVAWRFRVRRAEDQLEGLWRESTP